jgi:hypothetical protein
VNKLGGNKVDESDCISNGRFGFDKTMLEVVQFRFKKKGKYGHV